MNTKNEHKMNNYEQLAPDLDAELAAITKALHKKAALLSGKNRRREGLDYGFIDSLFDLTNSVGPVVRLFPGQSRSILLPKVGLGKIKFSVEAPHYADWKCDIKYMDFRGPRPVRRQAYLRQERGEYHNAVEVDRGQKPTFNAFSPADWRRQFPAQLVFDTTVATITHLRLGEPAIDHLPQRAARFVVRANSV